MSDSDHNQDALPPPEQAGSDSVSTLVAPHDPLPASSSAAVIVPIDISGVLPRLAAPTDKTVISKRLLAGEPLPAPMATQSLGEALVGKRFGHYELEEFVGGGGMGAVFRAKDTSLGRTVAVKVLSRDTTDEETIRRFRNEAQSAARLDHPNIARAYYVGEHEGWNYIVFEFIEGTNLREVVEKSGPLPLADALNYTLQVAEALEHASSRDVVHRDIKPSNVLVTPGGQIKLVDMGLARLHQVEASSDDLTASGVTLGTFDYISPEQARDPRMADVRSDIYSLGCTLYFMLAGRPPFPDGTALQKLLRHNGDDPPDPRLFRPDLPLAVIRLLEKMLAKRPAQRPQSPQELMALILAVADELALPGVGKPATVVLGPATPAYSFWRQAVSILVPVAALALVISLLNSIPSFQGQVQEIALRPKFHKGPVAATTNTDDSKQGSGEAKSNRATKGKTGSQPAEAASKGSAGNSTASEFPAKAVTPAEVTPMPASTVLTKPAEGTSPSAGAASTEPGGANDEREGGLLSAADSTSSAELRSVETSEGAGLSAGTPTATAPARSKTITRIVVRAESPTAPPLPPDHEAVHTLARACQRAAELSASEIELQFNGPLVEKPFEISAGRLSIRAAAGYRPVIVFRPEDFALASDRQMIRLTSSSTGRISFQGIELRMELPHEPSSGWALFAIYQMQQLDLSDCILTVKDSGSAGIPVQDQVAMLALQPRRITDTMKMMDDETKMVPPMGVSLTRCFARGEATFLFAAEESPLKVVWNQGLLVTSQRLIETGGSPLKPNAFARLDVDLDHVTAIIPQGLYAMKKRPGNAYQLKVDLRCRNSLLVTGPEAPMFEFTDLPSIEDVNLAFSGEGNLYPRNKGSFLRFHPQNRSEPTGEYDFGNNGRWSTERSLAGIQWQSEPPSMAETPASRHLVKHYLLEPTAANQAGFERGTLPEPTDSTASATSSE